MNTRKRIFIGSLILIVVVIISVYLPRMLHFGMNHTKTEQAYRQLIIISEMLNLYKKQNGDFPAEDEILLALVDPVEKVVDLKHSSILLDPWKNHIVYKRIESTMRSFYVLSKGENEKDEGGKGDDILVRPKDL